MLVVLIVKLLYRDLKLNVPFSQAKSLIKHEVFFLILPYFNAWFMKFHQNCRVLSNFLRGSTSRFKVEARAKILEEASIECYWWIGSQYRINSSLLHNCMLELKSSNNVMTSGIMKSSGHTSPLQHLCHGFTRCWNVLNHWRIRLYLQGAA